MEQKRSVTDHIFIKFILIFRNLRRTEEVEKALTNFCLGDGFGVL